MHELSQIKREGKMRKIINDENILMGTKELNSS